MPYFDTVIRGGTIVDGTMLPRFRGDVAIKEGRIAEIGQVRASDAAQEIDASGMIVAPGFIDLHTHYDAQIFWDPYCTLSGWHGVTSLVIGNCGFGFAPVAPGGRERAMRTMTRVEAIPYESMAAGLPWDWVTFPEYLDALDRLPKGVNVLPYVPAGPLMTWVMGLDAAKSRAATEDENLRIAALLDEAMEAGGCGWSAQRQPPGTQATFQRDYDGTPFVTDTMSNETALALAGVLRDRNEGFTQIIMTTPDPEADRAHIEELAAVSGRPIVWNAVIVDMRFPDAHRETLQWLASCRERGIPVYGQGLTTDPSFTFTLEDWNLWDEADPWRECTLGTPEERLRKFADPARRAALKADRPFLLPLENVILLKTSSERFKPFVNTRIVDAAPRAGMDIVDFLVDMVVDDRLTTLLQVPFTEESREAFGDLYRDPYVLLGPSDGGAHTKFATSGRFPTETIELAVREKEWLTLEQAHFRLSTLPARCAGFRDRGTLREGAPADVVVYDFESLRCLPEEVAHDMPGNEWRRICKADGYRHVIVNGEITLTEGEETGALPGRLLRHGAG